MNIHKSRSCLIEHDCSPLLLQEANSREQNDLCHHSCQVYRHWSVLQPSCLRQHFDFVSFWSFGGLRALRATLILAPQIHRGSMRLSGGCFSRLLLREACLDLVQGLHTYRRQTPELAVEVPVDVPSRKGALKAGRSATPLANFNHQGTKTRPKVEFPRERPLWIEFR